ncbi:AraC family transcriptional regulator ligand-binding domain-containing protein [Limnohabitans sp.]|uniref:AraC family transcriptional regulator n=1 Tax=Limnohabitans sp. TaxID=1907725 RepID=UPI00286F439E|nr:AraC family transcriptional regulator ligand-binding domain-containing protein [Limnohabitans sp.]
MPVWGTSVAIENAYAAKPASRRFVSVDDPVFAVHSLTGLLHWAQSVGWSAHDLFGRGYAETPADRMSYIRIREGINRALHRHGGLSLACETGRYKSVTQLGLLGPAFSAQATVGAAIEFGLRHQLLAGSLMAHTLVHDTSEPGTCAIESPQLFDDPECRGFLEIDHLLTNINVVKAFCAGEFPLIRVELPDHDPHVAAQLTQLLGVPVSCGAQVARMVFPDRVLEVRNPHHDPHTCAYWEALCEQEIRAIGLGNQSTLLAQLFSLNGHLLRLEDIAQCMHVSLRTLHRMLVREGIDYSQLLDQDRRNWSIQMLKQGASSEAISLVVGLSDARSFRRAFRRWTGLSPAEFRQLHQTPTTPALQPLPVAGN